MSDEVAMSRQCVIIESPFRARPPTDMTAYSPPKDPLDAAMQREIYTKYARMCLMDSIERGEAPFASHLLYPQVLDDNAGHERMLGIEMGFAWWECATIVFYTDFGFSPGMVEAHKLAMHRERPWAERKLTRTAFVKFINDTRLNHIVYRYLKYGAPQ